MLALNSCEQEPEIISVDADKKQHKVEVCHYDADTDTWKTLSISENALEAHLSHGDFKGDCSTAETYVPDDGFEELLIYNGWDVVRDDYVKTINIINIEQLHFTDPCCSSPFMEMVNFFSVRDLTGIEDFISLKSLTIDEHAINVMDLSKNIALETIDFRMVNGITNLDLTPNTSLTSITIIESIWIESIDLSNCPNLYNVNLFNIPKLAVFNLKNGNNEAISSVTLDMASLVLNCIQVDNAEYSDANWPLVDSPNAYFSEDCTN